MIEFPVGAEQLLTIRGLVATDPGTPIPIPVGYRKYCMVLSPAPGVYITTDPTAVYSTMPAGADYYKRMGIFEGSQQLYAYAGFPVVIDTITMFGWRLGELEVELPIDGPAMVVPPPVDLGFAQTVTVAISGGDYDSVEDALLSIVDAAVDKPYTVIIYPGVYKESPMTVPEYVAVTGVGGVDTPIIQAANIAAPLFTMSSHSSLNGLSMEGPAVDDGVLVAGGITEVNLHNVHIHSGQNGVHVDGAGSVCFAIDLEGFNLSGAVILATDGGTVNCSQVFASSCLMGFLCQDDASSIWISASGAQDCAVGLEAGDVGNGAARISAYNISLTECVVGLHTVGTAASVVGTVVSCRGTSTYDIYQEQGGSTIALGSSQIRSTLIRASVWSDLSITYDSDQVNDVSYHMLAEVSCGVPEVGRNASFGQGRRSTRGMVVLTSDETAGINSDGGNLTDVTALAADPTPGTTFSFQNNQVGCCIYFGLELESVGARKFYAIDLIQTLGAIKAVEEFTFTWEIWAGQWDPISVMAISRDTIHRYANEVFLRIGEEQILLGLTDESTQAAKAILGHTCYWVRVRIGGGDDLTTAPVFLQSFITTSNTRLNYTGFQIYTGLARFLSTVAANNGAWGETGGVLEANIAVGSGGVPTGWTHSILNGLMNGAGDAIYTQFAIPDGVDTSLPVWMNLGFVPATASGGVTDFIASLYPIPCAGVLVTDLTGGVDPVPRTLADTPVMSASVAQYTTASPDTTTVQKMQKVKFGPFDISSFYSGEILAIRLEADAVNGGTIAIFSLDLEAAFFSQGDLITH